MTDAIPDTARKVRYSIDLDKQHQEVLAGVAKSFKITQGEVVAILIDKMGSSMEQLSAAFTKCRTDKVAQREAKKAERAPIRELYQQFRTLTPAQIEAALEAAKTAEK